MCLPTKGKSGKKNVTSLERESSHQEKNMEKFSIYLYVTNEKCSNKKQVATSKKEVATCQQINQYLLPTH